jgi:hypothetical protein
VFHPAGLWIILLMPDHPGNFEFTAVIHTGIACG